MKKLIEVAPGKSVVLDKIEYLEDALGFARIHLTSGMFIDSHFSYESFKKLFEANMGAVQKKLDQIARFQTVPTP